jgi:hypothetical protein
MGYYAAMPDDFATEETTDPVVADDRNRSRADEHSSHRLRLLRAADRRFAGVLW